MGARVALQKNNSRLKKINLAQYGNVLRIACAAKRCLVQAPVGCEDMAAIGLYCDLFR
jgi:hypothetical protein